MGTRERIQTFIQQFGLDDEADVELRLRGNVLVGFSIDLRTRTDAGWEPVIRYDTRHGHLHVHRFWRPPESRIEDLEPPGSPAPDYTAQLDAASADVRRNWEHYGDLVRRRRSGP